MIDKRLIKEMPQAKQFVFKQVFMQWIGMLCNVGLVFSLSAVLVESLKKTISVTNIVVFVVIVSVLIILRIFVTRKASMYSHEASCDVKLHLRTRIYEKLLELKNDYTNYAATSELVQLSVEGVDQLETYFSRYLPQFFYSMLAPVTLFVLLVWMDVYSSLVLLLCVPLIPLSIIAIQKIAKKLLGKYWGSYAALSDSFLENLQGLTTLKIYQADGYKHEEMNKEAEHFRRITMKVLTMQLNSVSVMDIVAYGGAAIGSIVAIQGYMAGRVSLFSLLCIVLLSSEFFIPLRMLGSFFHIAMNGIAASAKIFKLLDVEVKHTKTKQLQDKHISVCLENVSFGYDSDRQVIKEVSLGVKEKEFVAIVGESGSGKSTIAKLLTGLASGYKGNLMVCDIERSEIDDASFYEHVMYVTHKSTLFKGSVRENLMAAKDGLCEEQLLEALKKVKLYDFLMEQDGLDTMLVENGNNLSGGQKQRLAIARALLADKDMYIFDEATSNIDLESEEAILQVIQEMTKTKTILMITHRLSTIATADRIYVLKDGSCIENGTHEELMMQHGMYASMYTKQQELEQFYGGSEDEERA
ncbi:cysteine ABC transporter ATP-binding protein [Amedibacterium intestinale]|uniref:ABC transporter ATP-binding protein/permease n=1 Tax=Amedibacterium intestinale TaxID=2583452 RepID=UPI001374615A|nr:ABC transporter ATP-binding protein/permease [Amedibacterium intestinale]BBK62291.1 cysteine ABC transporter ATP-binding protein [Amedibacterium intestinale]